MPRPRSTYHHHDVAAAARAEALKLLAEPEGDFSLPRVARALGVSHAALYRHFDGRRGLLAALAAEGYEGFGKLLARRTAGRSGLPLLEATFRAYFDFARTRPGHFRALFHPELRDKAGLPALEGAAQGSFDALGRILAGAGVRAGGAVPAALTWSAVHGLAMLWSDGWLPGRSRLTKAEAKALPESLARMVWVGLGGDGERAQRT